MKKLFFAVIGLVLAVGLCSCGKPAVPSEDKVREDIAAELAVYNPNAQLQELEVIKSAQEEDVYELTVALAAQTRYADWQYQANVVYELYDQGWFLEDVAWTEGRYALVRHPDADEMIDIVNNDQYLKEEYPDLLPVEMESIVNEEPESTERILFGWCVNEPMKHATQRTTYTAQFRYDPQEDNWLFEEYGEGDAFYRISSEYVPTCDFNGEWSGSYGRIWIDSFSGPILSVSWDGSESTEFSFMKCACPWGNQSEENEEEARWTDDKVWYYTNNDGYYFTIQFNRDSTWLAVYKGQMLIQYVDIRDALPPL